MIKKTGCGRPPRHLYFKHFYGSPDEFKFRGETYRPSDEVGPRGAFAPKKESSFTVFYNNNEGGGGGK